MCNRYPEWMIYRGIINKDCRDSAVYYRDELIKLGFPKSTLKLGILKRQSDNAEHVVLIVDVTEQLSRDRWEIEEIKG